MSKNKSYDINLFEAEKALRPSHFIWQKIVNISLSFNDEIENISTRNTRVYLQSI